VSNRHREIALRMALGAATTDVYGLFLRWAVVFVATGCAAGVVGGLIAGRQVMPLLFQIQPDDLGTLAAAVVAVLLISCAAILLPLRRAAAANPAMLLRPR
jgi:putative ABC transport system permease protein